MRVVLEDLLHQAIWQGNQASIPVLSMLVRSLNWLAQCCQTKRYSCAAAGAHLPNVELVGLLAFIQLILQQPACELQNCHFTQARCVLSQAAELGVWVYRGDQSSRLMLPVL